MSMNLVTTLYLIASICFIQALKGLSHPTTSRRGNLFGMLGMGLAILTTVGLIYKLGAELATAGIGYVIVGLLIGRNGGLVSNVHSSGTVYGYSGSTASNIGGLVGANAGQISDAWSDAGVHATGDGYAGGLVGSDITGEVSLANYQSRFKRWLSSLDGQPDVSAGDLPVWQARHQQVNRELLAAMAAVPTAC